MKMSKRDIVRIWAYKDDVNTMKKVMPELTNPKRLRLTLKTSLVRLENDLKDFDDIWSGRKKKQDVKKIF